MIHFPSINLTFSPYLDLPNIQKALSPIQNTISKVFEDEIVKTSLSYLKKPGMKFCGIMLANEVFETCNRKSLALFLLINFIAEEALEKFNSSTKAPIISQERVDSFKRTVNGDHSLEIHVPAAFLSAKLLQWKAASSLAGWASGSPLKVRDVGILLILKEVALSKFVLTALKHCKESSINRA